MKRSWDENFQALLRFKEIHGHTRVPQKYKEDPALGFWASYQRERRDKMRKDRLELLQKVGFCWDFSTADRYEEQWQERYTCLKAYYEQHGHSRLPKEYPADNALGSWCSKQRQLYLQGRLSRERQELLEALKFPWRTKSQSIGTNLDREDLDTRWMELYQKLEQFQANNGHCILPRNFQDQALVNWCKTQRQLGKRNKLRQERKDLLEKIGFVLLADKEGWDKMYLELHKYFISNGHPNVTPEEDLSLANWVAHQKHLLRRGRHHLHRHPLTNEQKEKLAEVGLVELPEVRVDAQVASSPEVVTSKEVRTMPPESIKPETQASSTYSAAEVPTIAAGLVLANLKRGGTPPVSSPVPDGKPSSEEIYQEAGFL